MKHSFNPNEVDILAKVVNEACQKLGYADDAAKQRLAARVLGFAALSERDFDTLLSVALSGKAAADAA